MSAEDRLSAWRNAQPPFEKPPRPVYRTLTKAELEELDRLFPTHNADWATAGRALQQTPAPEDTPPST